MKSPEREGRTPLLSSLFRAAGQGQCPLWAPIPHLQRGGGSRERGSLQLQDALIQTLVPDQGWKLELKNSLSGQRERI